MSHADLGRGRVVVLAGPSGAGKSRLAERLHTSRGWPIVRLDDFYRDHDDASMPRSEELGIIDWDHPDSWNGSAAAAALVELIDTGSTQTPVYDLSQSRAVGSTTVSAGPDQLVLAEGIFAAEVVSELRDAGVLHSAWCIHHRPFVTFVRRLARDLKERRKPPMVLVRRGLALMRAEPEVVRRQVELGAVSARATDVEAQLASAARNVP
ncbi:uridine kinase family protein [Knoellia subterranea]|uniref:ATP-binding protein n=1 Tax=Knoellia subterranea KCTC 19937 TaxID=1385521 RepID=A0A0A0JIU7_9MICO|nr:AAA family ATPase [Knoellia subterranea]KGN35566.1 ATP-binding protein [Knoellia subterranea KCTC 19937]